MSETPSPSTSKTPSTPPNSDTSTNRMASEHIETPSPSFFSAQSEASKSPRPSRSLPSTPGSTQFNFFNTNIVQNISSGADKKKKDEVQPRTPIITKEIWEKAEKIEKKIIAQKDAKVKFQLSYLLSPKKLRSYQKEKKAWKSQDPVNQALEECLRQRLTPKKPAAPPSAAPAKTSESKIECSCGQKLDRKVIDELSERFKEIGKIVEEKTNH